VVAFPRLIAIGKHGNKNCVIGVAVMIVTLGGEPGGGGAGAVYVNVTGNGPDD
jgi:hypothetical protein